MDPRVEKLIKDKSIPQRTPEWYDARSNMITASSASNFLVNNNETCSSYIKDFKLEDTFKINGKCCNPYGSKTRYIIEKVKGSKFKGSVATFWGQRYEDIVTDLYKLKHKTEIIEFGLIKHPKYNFLGASPDGITPDGVMIEIKCPYRRKITGIVPFYYWQQVQLQLECCNLERCDFVEYEFMEFGSEEEFLDDETLYKRPLHKGCYVKIAKLGDLDQSTTRYIYPKKEFLIFDPETEKHKEKELLDEVSRLLECSLHSSTVSSIVYWKAVSTSTVSIKRDKEWFSKVLGDFEKAWNEVLYYRTNNNIDKLIKSCPTEEDLNELSGKVLQMDLKDTKCVLYDSDSETD
jgi:putative phage-type endonuclease